MITVQTIIDMILTPELISAMGECGYQRVISALAVALPLLQLGFAFALLFLLAWAVYKGVVKD